MKIVFGPPYQSVILTQLGGAAANGGWQKNKPKGLCIISNRRTRRLILHVFEAFLPGLSTAFCTKVVDTNNLLANNFLKGCGHRLPAAGVPPGDFLQSILEPAYGPCYPLFWKESEGLFFPYGHAHTQQGASGCQNFDPPIGASILCKRSVQFRYGPKSSLVLGIQVWVERQNIVTWFIPFYRYELCDPIF